MTLHIANEYSNPGASGAIYPSVSLYLVRWLSVAAATNLPPSLLNSCGLCPCTSANGMTGEVGLVLWEDSPFFQTNALSDKEL